MIKLNLGDSRKVPEGWIFIDYSLASRIASIPILGWIFKHLKIFNNERPSNLFIHDLTKPCLGQIIALILYIVLIVLNI